LTEKQKRKEEKNQTQREIHRRQRQCRIVILRRQREYRIGILRRQNECRILILRRQTECRILIAAAKTYSRIVIHRIQKRKWNCDSGSKTNSRIVIDRRQRECTYMAAGHLERLLFFCFAKKNILGVMGRDRKFESPPEQSFTLLKASHILSFARRSSNTCSAFQDIQCSRG
jgi:hypothetical protein